MTCEELTRVVTDYLEGRLSGWDRTRFQFHLGICRGCRAYLRQMRQTIRALGSVPAPVMSPELRDEMARRFRGWASKSAPAAGEKGDGPPD